MEINFVEQDTLDEMITNTGASVSDISFQSSVMLVFLRHFGCTFCREALGEISTRKQELESSGAKIVFVHMAENEVAQQYFERYDIKNPIHVSDIDCRFYKEFGLMKGTFNQLFGLSVWVRGFQAGVVDGHGVGWKQLGDGFQMPGIFLIHRGAVKDQYIHKTAADKPDYAKLVECCPL